MAVYKMTPTKSNLLKAKNTLQLMRDGYDIMDKKRVVLLREMMSRIETARELEKQFSEETEKLYHVLEELTVTMGESALRDIARTIPEKGGVKIHYEKVMGVPIPSIDFPEEKLQLTYGFLETNPLMDQAGYEMNKILDLIFRLAEMETTVYNLALEIKKAQKRTNSLDKVQIPKYESMISYINQTLEEKEREEFFRTKQIKRIQSSKPKRIRLKEIKEEE